MVYLAQSWTRCPEVDCEGPIYLAVRWELSEPLLNHYGKGGWHRTTLGGSATLLAMIPEGSRAELDPSVPAQIRVEWPGIIELAEQQRSPATVLMGCRAVLELALRELEDLAVKRGLPASTSKSDRLNDRIDKLATKGMISSTLRDWAHELRLDGNDGAHELKADGERALTFARFVEFFLEATFVMESRLKTVRRMPVDASPPDSDPSLDV
ncbi:MAG: DUF4145 domain-containing protein [Alcaligenaceae bacterium]|nr:MAG: DUF4145 domain-containing protein [Alcaligenaceae bacterium]